MTQATKRTTKGMLSVLGAVIVAGTGSVWSAARAGEPVEGTVVGEYRATATIEDAANACGAAYEGPIEYVVRVVEGADGVRLVFDQVGSPDAPAGTVGPDGAPETVATDGVESFEGGVAESPTRLRFRKGYRYTKPDGCVEEWATAYVDFGEPVFPVAVPGRTGDAGDAGGARTGPGTGEPEVPAAPASQPGSGGPDMVVVVLVIVVLLALLSGLGWAFLASDGEENPVLRWLRNLLRIGGRTPKGRAGSTVGMGDLKEAVDAAADGAKNMGAKAEMGGTAEEREAHGIEEPEDAYDTGLGDAVNWVAGKLFDKRYSPEEREKREKERQEKERRKRYQEWRNRPESHSQYCGIHQPGVCHRDCPPEAYDEATPEQLAEFDEWLSGLGQVLF